MINVFISLAEWFVVLGIFIVIGLWLNKADKEKPRAKTKAEQEAEEIIYQLL